MKTVTLLLHAHLKRYAESAITEVTVTTDLNDTVGQILDTLNVPTAEIFALMVKGKQIELDYIPEAGEIIEALPIISGG